jgi:hypothetical protein
MSREQHAARRSSHQPHLESPRHPDLHPATSPGGAGSRQYVLGDLLIRLSFGIDAEVSHLLCVHLLAQLSGTMEIPVERGAGFPAFQPLPDRRQRSFESTPWMIAPGMARRYSAHRMWGYFRGSSGLRELERFTLCRREGAITPPAFRSGLPKERCLPKVRCLPRGRCLPREPCLPRERCLPRELCPPTALCLPRGPHRP